VLKVGEAGLQSSGADREVAKCWEGSSRIFQKLLDDAAKADQNLASLLLTNGLRKQAVCGGEGSKLLSIEKINFQTT
jgi:hypothetical protein